MKNTYQIGAGSPTGSDPRSVAAADLDGGGEPDLAGANYEANTVSVLLSTCPP